MPADSAQTLFVSQRDTPEARVLLAEGVLDSKSYISLRDAIIKTAIDECPAIVVDVTALVVPAESALAVFTSASWHIHEWLDVPLVLVCRHSKGRNALARNGITRYLRVYSSVEDALAALSDGTEDICR